MIFPTKYIKSILQKTFVVRTKAWLRPRLLFFYAVLTGLLSLLDESGFSPAVEATFLFRNHKSTSMLEMPLIESDFLILSGFLFIFSTTLKSRSY
jgi:hypothetical protein